MSAAPDRESLVATIRSHGRRMVIPVLILIAATGAGMYLYFTVQLEWQRWAVIAGYALVVVFLVIGPWLSWRSRRYTVTTRRTILHHGVFTRHRREVLHSSATDVVMRRGPLQVMFGSGTVTILVGGDRPARLVDVPSAALVQEALLDLGEVQRGARDRLRRSTGDPLAGP